MDLNTYSFVIKCGGSTLAALPDSFFHELASLVQNGWKPILVHGGGPEITETLQRLGVTSRFVDGLRVTDEEVLDTVESVLAGTLNKRIVRRMQLQGIQAVGLSGSDGGLLEAKRVADHRVGFVGDIVRVNDHLLRGLSELGYVPVVSPIGADSTGQRYNVNADTAAGAVATALDARQLIVVTDVPGLWVEKDGERMILPEVTGLEIEDMIRKGDITGGMIPKVRAALQCLHGTVESVRIISGTDPLALTRALHGEAVGTQIQGVTASDIERRMLG
jgi:acetylglutamate kinase